MIRSLMLSLLLTVAIAAGAADFNTHFTDATLRVNFTVVPQHDNVDLRIDTIAQWSGWHGRRVNLDHVLYPEDLQIYIVDAATRDTLYVDAKSPEAFSENDTPQPLHVAFLVPKPIRPAEILIGMYGYEGPRRVLQKTATASLSAERLAAMHPRKDHKPLPYTTLRQAQRPDSAMYLAIVAEGYTADEMPQFLERAQRLDSVLFRQPCFRECADRVNVVCVHLPSPQSGITIPSQQVNIDSALGAHFDSFGLERLMTIPDTWRLFDALEGIPADKILILANTPKYGGSGSYNEYAIVSAGHPDFAEILIHEFGHSFAWLGDEYESEYAVSYTPDFEPLEPNITTLADFSKKWQNLIDSGEASLIEGAGYQSKGVWRGCEHCLMRAIEDKTFCAVCNQAVKRTIQYYTGR